MLVKKKLFKVNIDTITLIKKQKWLKCLKIFGVVSPIFKLKPNKKKSISDHLS